MIQSLYHINFLDIRMNLSSNRASSFIKYLPIFGLILCFILFIFKTNNSITYGNNACLNDIKTVETKEQIEIRNVTIEYCNTSAVLENCSKSDFVRSRAKQRIASDRNAIFLHGECTLDLGNNYHISVDDILFGYDVLFEVDGLYSTGSWLGAQFQSSPQDAMVFQHLLWKIKPDLIIDLGTNVGGSALFFASIMSFYNEQGRIITIDMKPFTQNWVNHDHVKCKECGNPSENNLWKKYVTFIQGSTTDPKTIASVKSYVTNATRVFISHDASHSGNIVYQDLLNYADFVSVDSYLVVQDTKLDRIGRSQNGPLSAVRRFLQHQNSSSVNYTYVVDRSAEMFYYSQHAYGWLKRIK